MDEEEKEEEASDCSDMRQKYVEIEGEEEEGESG